MVFDIAGKIAIVTGGASGLGLESAKALLRSGLRGVTIADINDVNGKKAVQDLEKEFGPNKAIYIPVDVTDYHEFENVFKETIKKFNNIDILINNAGILNERVWARTVAVNVVGVINGIILAMDNYIPKYKSGDEGLIVNIASVVALEAVPMIPIYCGTKHAVLGLSVSFGAKVHYERTKVKFLTICPGVTETPMVPQLATNTLGDDYKKLEQELLKEYPGQETGAYSKALVNVIKNAGRGTIWIIEDSKEPYQYFLPGRQSFAPK